MSRFERPLEFRRMQLQLMTADQARGHVEMLHSNARTVWEHTGEPLCPNMVTALLEVRARLEAADTHFDPDRVADALAAVEARLGTVGGIPKLKLMEQEEPRLVKSFVQEEYFRRVPDECEADWQPELAMLAAKACEGQAQDRRRWAEVAALEAKRAEEAAEAAAMQMRQ
tara:strand:+ start:36 stop:545 length:510 start_codon:yes stop_codon:yes gene_type:complete